MAGLDRTSPAMTVLIGHGFRTLPLASAPRLPGIADQRLAERPEGARNPMRGGDDLIECTLDPVAVLLRDDERRQQLDGMAGVTGDLGEHLVVAEQRDGDPLAEQ